MDYIRSVFRQSSDARTYRITQQVLDQAINVDFRRDQNALTFNTTVFPYHLTFGMILTPDMAGSICNLNETVCCL